MTNEEALAEAERRWGKKAWCTWDGPVDKTRAVRPYQVGASLLSEDPKAEWGYGVSWESAFEDADRRTK